MKPSICWTVNEYCSFSQYCLKYFPVLCCICNVHSFVTSLQILRANPPQSAFPSFLHCSTFLAPSLKTLSAFHFSLGIPTCYPSFFCFPKGLWATLASVPPFSFSSPPPPPFCCVLTMVSSTHPPGNSNREGLSGISSPWKVSEYVIVSNSLEILLYSVCP